MLKAGRQKRHFSKKWKSVHESLSAFGKYGDTEELHELRTSIKKIKSYLELDEKHFSGKKYDQHFKPIEKLFKNAGEIRDAQVELELMKKHSILTPATEKQLTDILVKQSEKLDDAIDDYLHLFKGKPGFFLKRFSDISTGKIEQLMKKQVDKIDKKFSGKPGTDQVHDCRKKLKTLYYQAGLFSSSVEKKIKLNRAYLKKLEQAIGKWHDTVSVIAIVEKTIYEQPVMERLQKSKAKQLEEIKTMAKDFKQKAFVK